MKNELYNQLKPESISEIEFFTTLRQQQILKPDYRSDIEKWGNYCYIPLDIPKFHNSKFVEWFFEKAVPVRKLKSDISTDQYGGTNFDSIDVNIDQWQGGGIWEQNNQNDFLTLFPELYNDIITYFPFKYIGKITCWSSNQHVRWHRDYSRFTDNPSSFRIMIHDENPKQTLYIAENLPDTKIEVSNKFLIPRLEETNSFVWNNSRLKHGSFFNFTLNKVHPRKILLILDRYELDADRYNDLLERSVKKYQDNVLMSKYTLSDFIKL